MSFDSLLWLDRELQVLEQERVRRRLRERSGAQRGSVELDGQVFVSFGSNDYLGLAADARLVSAASDCAQQSGWGSASSPSITGHTTAQSELESRVADFEAAPAALVFGSGFAANVSVVTSLTGRGDSIFSDAKNHASLIDGCRLSRATTHIYRHNDIEQLTEMLRRAPATGRRLIVTDGLFSMDGDLARLPELVELCEQFQAMLVVDEAHATGVLGEHGRGSCEHFGVEDRVPVRVGTLSKAVGSIGGFVVGEQRLVDWLVNRARSFIFSTALPAACHAASLAGLELIQQEPQRRHRLASLATSVRGEFSKLGWQHLGDAGPIIPLRLGSPEAVLAASDKLLSAGLHVPAIRPPSVPEGESLLRVSLSAAHTDEEVERLVGAVATL